MPVSVGSQMRSMNFVSSRVREYTCTYIRACRIDRLAPPRPSPWQGGPNPGDSYYECGSFATTCTWRKYVPAKKDGGKGDHDGGAGAGGGAGGRYGGGAESEGGEKGKGGACSGSNWGKLFRDGEKHGGGVEGEDRTGSGNTAGGYESDVDVAERISDWRNKKQGSEHSDSFRPSEDTINSPSYPRFERNNLGRFARDGILGELAFTFFTFMMPLAIVALLVKEVRGARD